MSHITAQQTEKVTWTFSLSCDTVFVLEVHSKTVRFCSDSKAIMNECRKGINDSELEFVSICKLSCAFAIFGVRPSDQFINDEFFREIEKVVSNWRTGKVAEVASITVSCLSQVSKTLQCVGKNRDTLCARKKKLNREESGLGGRRWRETSVGVSLRSLLRLSVSLCFSFLSVSPLFRSMSLSLHSLLVSVSPGLSLSLCFSVSPCLTLCLFSLFCALCLSLSVSALSVSLSARSLLSISLRSLSPLSVSVLFVSPHCALFSVSLSLRSLSFSVCLCALCLPLSVFLSLFLSASHHLFFLSLSPGTLFLSPSLCLSLSCRRG